MATARSTTRVRLYHLHIHPILLSHLLSRRVRQDDAFEVNTANPSPLFSRLIALLALLPGLLLHSSSKLSSGHARLSLIVLPHHTTTL